MKIWRFEGGWASALSQSFTLHPTLNQGIVAYRPTRTDALIVNRSTVMTYTFEILGISPILQFFNHQQEIAQQPTWTGVEYVSAYRCTLDALIESVEVVPAKRGWNRDDVVDTVVNFWLNNSDIIHRWRDRLRDAGQENILVARLADLRSLQNSFERLLQ